MSTIRQRILALLDNMTGMHHGTNFGRIRRENFYSDWSVGPKMAIITENGKVRAFGNVLWVVHDYDVMGRLVSRMRMAAPAKEGECVVYGKAARPWARRRTLLAGLFMHFPPRP